MTPDLLTDAELAERLRNARDLTRAEVAVLLAEQRRRERAKGGAPMKLSTLRDALRADACSRRHAATWAARTGALVAYDDPAGVLEALEDDRAETYSEREGLVCALLDAYQSTGARLWSAMLVVAFFPMLSTLERRMLSNTVVQDERAQLALVSFMRAIRDVSPQRVHLACALRRRTHRLTWQVLRRERTHEDCARFDVPPEDAPAPVESPPLLEQAPADVRGWLLHLFDSAEVSDDIRDVLLHVSYDGVGSNGLRAYVARTYGGTAEEQDRRYQNLKRGRTRALARMRALALAEAT